MNTRPVMRYDDIGTIYSDGAKAYILDLFSDKIIQIEEEYSFRKRDRNNEVFAIPYGYKIVRVDSSFLQGQERGNFENQELLKVRLLESWGTYDNFLRKSGAFTAIYQGRVVGVIIGTVRFKNVILIDTEIDNNHRRKGLYKWILIISKWDMIKLQINIQKHFLMS